jgi:hypothetical protein
MFAKAAFGLAIVLVTASGALAITKSIAPGHDARAYNTPGACAQWFSWGCGLGTERGVFEFNRDWARGH